MKRPLLPFLTLLLALAPPLLAQQTVTVGGAVFPVAKGWTQSAQTDGSVVLAPPDLPKGVVVTLTLLGGEPSDGSLDALKNRLNADWKEFQAIGPMVADDGGKITNAGGAVVMDARFALLKTPQGVNLCVWLVMLSTNKRIERMVFITTTPEAFDKYGDAVTTMINAATYITPKPAAAAVAASTPVPAPGAKVAPTLGHLTATIPAGWTARKTDRELLLSPTDLPAGDSLEIVVLPSVPAAGQLPAALAAAWTDAAQRLHLAPTRTVDNTAYDAKEQRTSFRGWPYIRADGVLHDPADGHDESVTLAVVAVNNRFERILVHSRQRNIDLTRYSASQSPVYHQDIEQFLFTLHFDDFKEPALRPATLKGDTPVGVWSGISFIGGSLHTAYAICFSNSQVFFASRFPLRGCSDFNTWIDAEEFPRYWGTWTFANGKGSFKMIFGDIPITAKGNDLVLTTNKTDHTFIRLPSVDNLRLDGTYGFPQASGKNPAITFSPDGRFDDHGALYLLRVETNFPFSLTTEPGAGTYAVKDYTLLLNYTDGRKYRIAFPGSAVEPHTPSPLTLPLGFGDQQLKKL